MPLNSSIPILTLEKANDWSFGAGLQEISINVLRIFPNALTEELAQYASGLRQHSRIYEFTVKVFPYSTLKSTDYPDTSDYLTLVDFLKEDKPMRVKGCTLGRYGTLAAQQIATVRAKLLNRHVTLASFETNDKEGSSYNELSMRLISKNYE